MSKNKRNRIRIIPGIIANDFWRKIIALFFAILVWERVTARLDVPLKMHGIPVSISMPGYVLLENRQVKIDIGLNGSQQQFNKITTNDIKIAVTIQNPKEGLNKLTISQHNITVPKGVSISSINPKEIDIYIDEKITKKVPVKLIYSGSLLEGYAINPLLIIPQEVTITGPESIIGKMEYMKTDPIVLRKDFVEDFDCQSKIDTENKNIAVNPKEISARIEVFKEFEIRKFKNIPIKPLGYIQNSNKMQIKTNNALVIVEGLKNIIEVTTSDEIRVFIDLSNIEKPGEYTLNVQCLLENNNLSVKEISPKTVNVLITK